MEELEQSVIRLMVTQSQHNDRIEKSEKKVDSIQQNLHNLEVSIQKGQNRALVTALLVTINVVISVALLMLKK